MVINQTGMNEPLTNLTHMLRIPRQLEVRCLPPAPAAAPSTSPSAAQTQTGTETETQFSGMEFMILYYYFLESF